VQGEQIRQAGRRKVKLVRSYGCVTERGGLGSAEMKTTRK
jgi:hypothetical protein